MFQMRFLMNILLMLAIGIASVEIPVSGEETEFALESETSIVLPAL